MTLIAAERLLDASERVTRIARADFRTVREQPWNPEVGANASEMVREGEEAPRPLADVARCAGGDVVTTLDDILRALRCGACRTPDAVAACKVCREGEAAAEAVRARWALPVLTSCSDCAHRMSNGSHGHCVHEAMTEARPVDVFNVPPAWCPLRGQR